MSLAEWFAAYKPCIRTNVDWDALWKVRPVPRLRLLSHHDDVVLYHPWYRSGHWRHGSPQKAYRVARGRRHPGQSPRSGDGCAGGSAVFGHDSAWPGGLSGIQMTTFISEV